MAKQFEFDGDWNVLADEYEELEEENKSLRKNVNHRAGKCADLQEENEDLQEENKNLREENEILRCSKGGTPEKVGHEEMIQYLMGENKKLKSKIDKVIELFKAGDELDLYDYIADLDYEEED